MKINTVSLAVTSKFGVLNSHFFTSEIFNTIKKLRTEEIYKRTREDLSHVSDYMQRVAIKLLKSSLPSFESFNHNLFMTSSQLKKVIYSLETKTFQQNCGAGAIEAVAIIGVIDYIKHSKESQRCAEEEKRVIIERLNEIEVFLEQRKTKTQITKDSKCQN